MGVLYTFSSPNGKSRVLLTDENTCSANEEYLTEPVISGDYNGSNIYSYRWGGNLYGISGQSDRRCAISLFSESDSDYQLRIYTTLRPNETIRTWANFLYEQTVPNTSFGYQQNIPLGLGGTPSDSRLNGWEHYLDTNIPVFSSNVQALSYVDATSESVAKEILKNALNYKASDIEPITDDIYLYTLGVLQTWDNTGLIYENDGSGVAIHKGIRGKLLQGSLSLYPISGISDASLKYGIKISDDIEWLYLEETDGYSGTWIEVTEMSIDFLYRKRVNELGTFHASKIALDTNVEYNAKIPIFEDEETAQGYVDGDVDITSATNWATISNNYPIANGTGDGDDETEFSTVRAKNFFSQTYICSSSAIQEISNALFDTDATGITHLWEKIKEGVEMYGQDPMQVVQGLMFFPVVLSEVFTEWASQQYVYFGGYKLDLQSGVKKLNFPNGYKSIGHITIKKTFNNWRDYEPFTKLFVYLPYVGTYQLSLERYYNKDTEVRYYIDIRTGGCVVCLIADGLLMDYFNGQMGVQMPITLTDKNNYANSQIQTLLGGVQREGNTLTGAGNVASMSNAYVATAVGTAGTMINAYRTTYELSQNNINNFNKTRGGSTSMLNEYLPQYVTFMFEIQQDDPTANHDSLIGLPSNASGNLGDFSGYLQVESVNLNCGIATQNEKNKILSMLHNGIYI